MRKWSELSPVRKWLSVAASVLVASLPVLAEVSEQFKQACEVFLP